MDPPLSSISTISSVASCSVMASPSLWTTNRRLIAISAAVSITAANQSVPTARRKPP